MAEPPVQGELAVLDGADENRFHPARVSGKLIGNMIVEGAGRALEWPEQHERSAPVGFGEAGADVPDEYQADLVRVGTDDQRPQTAAAGRFPPADDHFGAVA